MLNRLIRRPVFYQFKSLKRLFSEKAIAPSQDFRLETKEDIDIKYEDEAYYLSKEFKQIEDEKTRMSQDYVGEDLTEHCKREVDIILDRYLRLNEIEAQHFMFRMKQLMANTVSTNPYKIHIYYPKEIIKPLFESAEQHMNPNYEKLQNLLSSMTPFIASGFFTGGAQAAEAAAEEAKTEKAASKEEQKEVKKEVNLKLKKRKQHMIFNCFHLTLLRR